MKINNNFISEELKEVMNLKTLHKLEEAFNNFLTHRIPDLDIITKRAILEVWFITDNEIKSINSERRNKDKVTDVLSWKMYEKDMKDNRFFGEIYLSDKYLLKQAEKKGIEPEKEILLMIVHGFLHVCDYTHENDEDERVMNEETVRILDEIGIDYSIELI